uniref:Uncharacterized protein n=1 Tax=Aegilops tauschii subsp. strangulata TaxID=200361 RepID=A0A453IBW7_AEGTS
MAIINRYFVFYTKQHMPIICCKPTVSKEQIRHWNIISFTVLLQNSFHKRNKTCSSPV